ncbi:hypothetical protein [Halomicrobium salinisoli]|uniref:hypothetical protein n=1 Tax=Halomicrobium salinisoli TaxID=2878391 RepID=UPI001CF00836|nr:hypothetical protein [Halomicrobium salinisoli]
MADDTATIELSRPEAREVINALSTEIATESGPEEERALNVREFLQREFDFEDSDFSDHDDDGGIFTLSPAAWFGDDDEDTHDVQLSRSEAVEVDLALAEQEGSSEGEAETIMDLRERLDEAFDLGRG